MVSGRIRDLENNPVEGFTVQAFDKEPLHPDDRLGKARTDENGYFEIPFASSVFKSFFERYPSIYLVVRDQDGIPLIRSDPRENTTGRVDFEVKTTELIPDPLAPNIYSNSTSRLGGSFESLLNGDSVDLSLDRAQTMSGIVMGAINSWVSFRDAEVAKFSGYDGIQVPEIPRQKKHDHITRWDEAVLPK